MPTWYSLECDHRDGWSIFSEADTEPTGDDLLCPEAGHPAVILKKLPLHRSLRITIAAAGTAPTSQADRRTRFFLELSTWDGANRLLSGRLYTWEEALERASLFHNLSWEAAAQRWRHLRMSAVDGGSRPWRV
jgi:hypothetical protein